MPRRAPASLLIIIGVLGLLLCLPQAQAYVRAWVDLPPAKLATYTVTSTNRLLSCSVPSTLMLSAKTGDYPATGNFFQCTNNYGAPVTLTWSIANNGGNLNLRVNSTPVTLAADGVTACRAVTFTTVGALDHKTQRTMTFKGTTAPTAAFYAEIQFTALVDLENGNKNTGGCP